MSSILNKKIESLEVKKDVSLEASFFGEKYGILDLCAVLDTREVVDIEMQIVFQKDLFKRLEYYASKLTSSQLLKGEEYTKIKPVIVVAILDFNFLDVEEYVSETSVVLAKHKEYEIKDMHKYYIVELPKFRKHCPNLNNTLEQWLTFIDRKNLKGVKQAMEINKKIEKAEEEYKYLTGEEEVRRRAELRLKYLRDTNSIKAYAIEEGRAEGRAKGLAEGLEKGKLQANLDNAKKMKAEKIDIEIIAKITNLTIEEIKKL